ncbi:MAG: DUF4097 family beta strand repeat protein [Clostridia bacterium]|nr:DUF4097 family beta strand repeat protein [Clostridia bacterium]
MKPTSIIFMILAAILIVVGVIICIVGGSMAGNDNPLLCDVVDAEGNEITTYSLSEYDLSDISIDIKNAEVNIIGQSTENYIEFKNINTVTYDFVINKHKLDLSTVNPFNISSMVKFRENEGGFSGLRYYLYLGRYKEKVSQINIYVTPELALDSIKVSVKNGDITVKNMISDTEYDLTAVKGNVVCENTATAAALTVNTNKGNFTFNTSDVKSLDFVIENGNGKFILNKQYNFSCQCTSGKIYLDDENIGESYAGVYPETVIQEENGVVIPILVKGKITAGDLVIDTAE